MTKLNQEQKEKLEWAKEQFDTGQLEGSGYDIKMRLLKEGLDQETIKAFGQYFVQQGLANGWLLDELGF